MAEMNVGTGEVPMQRRRRSGALNLMRNEQSPEILELLAAMAKLRAGRRCEIDAIRMLELFELFQDAGQQYWAGMAAQIATQAVRPHCHPADSCK